MLVPVLALLLAGCSSGDPREPTALPAAPEGTRWQGHGQVVLAVPKEWATRIGPCSAGDENTVWYSESHAVYDCSDSFTGDVQLHVEADPARAPEQDARCETSLPSLCIVTFSVPGTDARFTLRSQKLNHPLQLFARIQESAMTLPEGWSTVPQIPMQGTEEEARALFAVAGLEVEFVERPKDVDLGVAYYGITRTEPPTGFAVRRGTTVLVFNDSDASRR